MAMKSYIVILTLVAGLTVSSQNLDRHFYSHEAGQDFDGLEPLHIRLKREDNVAAPAVTTTSTTTPPRSSLNQNSNDNDGADSNSSSDSTSTEQNADDSGGGGMTTTTVSDEDVDDADKSRGHNRPDINIDTFDVKGGDEKINATIKAHITKDHLNRSDDYFRYYNSSFAPFNGSWIDLDAWNRTKPGLVIEHPMLSKSYRRAATVNLSFKFPFYGHWVKNITIATGGFLYTGEYVHSWLAATQYIAPLMANFDTSQEETATVRYADNSSCLVVEWGNVYLKYRDESDKHKHVAGPFTFQAILHKNGDIVFAYKTIPMTITTIEDGEHPVKVGLSDAYIIERTIFFVRRKTIYEYDRVSMKDKEINNFTAIHLTALPRCNQKYDCESCVGLSLSFEEGPDQKCMWCPSANLCSDGLDRNKQTWLKSNCENDQVHVQGDPAQCELAKNSNKYIPGRGQDSSYNVYDNNKNGDNHYDDNHEDGYNDHVYGSHDQAKLKDKAKVHHAGIATLSIVIILVLTVCGWFVYAYFFPHTWSGQLLIKYRPTRWHWRRGEAGYTAASIHM